MPVSVVIPRARAANWSADALLSLTTRSRAVPWFGAPAGRFSCSPRGSLRLESLKLLAALFPDADELHDSYSEWVKSAEASVKLLTRPGVTVEPYTIDLDDFLATVSRCPRDAKARTAYVVEKLSCKLSKLGETTLEPFQPGTAFPPAAVSNSRRHRVLRPLRHESRTLPELG
jgi:hypothetical protein